eukprot:gene3881-6371_t
MATNLKKILEEIGLLEHPFLKVPLDEVVRISKSCQKLIDSEIVSISKSFDEVISKQESAENIDLRLQSFYQRLESLEQRLHDIKQAEEHVLRVCSMRSRHLKDVESMRFDKCNSLKVYLLRSDELYSLDLWKQTRVSRLLIDYLIRKGFYDTAEQLTNVPMLRDLIDLRPFQEMKSLEASIRRKDFDPVFAWYSKHEQRLKKMGSTLKYRLHLHIFIERFQDVKPIDALSYSHSHLQGCSKEQLSEISTLINLLLCSCSESEKQRGLNSEERLEDLIQQVRHNNFALHGMTAQSVFETTLQIVDMGKLAHGLPLACHKSSRLFCRISGEKMDEHNPPYMLPNGQALVNMQEENQHIRCPVTEKVFQFNDCKRVYIVS